MRVGLAVVGFLTLCGMTAPAGFAATTAVEPHAPAPLSGTELEEVVAPIALYPDDLIAIVLPASTYPLQVVQAARFLEATKSDTTLKPDDSWDDAIVALTNYPEVVDLLNRDLDWTWKLGQAVITQQSDVLDAVKRFRERAHVAGNLDSDERQVVEVTPQAIAIKPADPKVLYVPYYEPAQVTVVQRTPVYHYYPAAYPVYYYPYPDDYLFGWPRFWGVSTFYSLGWSTHHVHVHHHHDHGHPYYSWRYWDRYWYRHSRPWVAYGSSHNHRRDHWNRGGWNHDDWKRRNHDWRHDSHRGGARQDGWQHHDRDRRQGGDWARRDSDRNDRERSWATTTRSNPFPGADRRPNGTREAGQVRNSVTPRDSTTFRNRWSSNAVRPTPPHNRQSRDSVDRPRRQEYAASQAFQPRQRAEQAQRAQPRESFQRPQRFESRGGGEPRGGFRSRQRSEPPRAEGAPRQRAEHTQQARVERRDSQGQRQAEPNRSRDGRGNPRGDGGFRGGFRSQHQR
jgi:Protein of unknown function (DUF3300)